MRRCARAPRALRMTSRSCCDGAAPLPGPRMDASKGRRAPALGGPSGEEESPGQPRHSSPGPRRPAGLAGFRNAIAPLLTEPDLCLQRGSQLAGQREHLSRRKFPFAAAAKAVVSPAGPLRGGGALLRQPPCLAVLRGRWFAVRGAQLLPPPRPWEPAGRGARCHLPPHGQGALGLGNSNSDLRGSPRNLETSHSPWWCSLYVLRKKN